MFEIKERGKYTCCWGECTLSWVSGVVAASSASGLIVCVVNASSPSGFMHIAVEKSRDFVAK